MDFDDIRIEKLKQKIMRFNGLMEELSQELTAMFHEGKKEEFHDIIITMLRSLDKAQETVKTAYELVFGKDITEKSFNGSGRGP
ncbi:MAG: hypothetical protein ACFE94_15245 [Candidatus Hodarchaeota archaeon]